MLTNLSLANFKSWRSIPAMRLAPITGLFGANSSGKTSILQLLLMLKQTANSSDRAQVLDFGDERSLVSLGMFRDVIFRHDPSSKLSWSFAWSLPKLLSIASPERPQGILFAGKTISFTATVNGNGDGYNLVDSMEYGFAEHRFGMSLKPGSDHHYNLGSSEGSFAFTRTQGRAWPLPAPVKCYGFPDQVRAYFQNAGFLSDLELEFEKMFHQVYYLGPLREHPKRQYGWSGSQPADMGQRGERVIDALLAAQARGNSVSRGQGRSRATVEQCVAIWLRKLGLIHSFSVQPIAGGANLYQVLVQKDPGSTPVLITDVGFGVSQILPVLALCYYVPEGSTIILEQPEIHLHPSVQAGLADVFLDASRTRKVQIIIESHSEHLLMRLQRRIAEGQVASKHTALYFCEIADGESTLTPLDMDLFGSIRNYPKAFFGDAFGEAAAMAEAAAKRKKSEAA